jgi:glycosyltransferase involved in cell wall biosynthesis
MTSVLLVHQPVDGGVARHVADLAAGLARLGCDVTVTGPSRPDALASNVKHIELPLVRAVAARTDASAVRRFAAIVRTVRPDIIHAHSSKAGAITRAARARSPKIPVIYSPHGYAFAGFFDHDYERVAYRLVERSLARLATRVLCVCEAEARLARGIGPGGRVRVVYNGIATAAPATPTPELAGLRSRGPVVCSLTQLRPGKGVETLIDAMPAVLRVRPDAHLAIWGDGPLRESLGRRVTGLAVERAVSFLGAASDPARALSGADVFVMPSWHEAFPYVLLEAMAASVPIVATDVGGVREAVRPHDEGVLVRARDTGALGRAITTLLDDSLARQRLAAAAHRRVIERFDTEQMVRGIHGVYREVR